MFENIDAVLQRGELVSGVVLFIDTTQCDTLHNLHSQVDTAYYTPLGLTLVTLFPSLPSRTQ